jgi:hypothetical protein
MKRYEMALLGLFPMTYAMLKSSAIVSKAMVRHYRRHQDHRVARVYQMFG